jgi:inner membrane protein
MDPVTHALGSLALSRAGLQKTTRLAMPLLLVSGVAADIDLLSRFGGADLYLRLHRTLAHSILGSVILSALIAGAFCRFAPNDPQRPLRFGRAFGVCLAGSACHLLLDLCNSSGIQLFWPFQSKWYALDWLAWLDPWILFLLLAGLLMPSLFGLVSEEIGARRRNRGPKSGALTALVFIAIYLGARIGIHSRAVNMLFSREYHGAVPESVAAFPTSASPFLWRGVVDTTIRLEELDVSLAPGSYFDPERTNTRFKPEPSPALDAAQQTQAAQRFLRYARFPLATVEHTESGYRVQIRDLRFPPGSGGWDNLLAVIDLDSELRVQVAEIQFEAEEKH